MKSKMSTYITEMVSKVAFAPVAQFRSVGLRKGSFAFCLALCTVGLSLSAGAQGPTFITFEAPGAMITNGSGINPEGAITAGHIRTRSRTQTSLATRFTAEISTVNR